MMRPLFQGSNPPALVCDSSVLWRLHHVCDIVEQRRPCPWRSCQGGQRKVHQHHHHRHIRPVCHHVFFLSETRSWVCSTTASQPSLRLNVCSKCSTLACSSTRDHIWGDQDNHVDRDDDQRFSFSIESVMGSRFYAVLEICVIWFLSNTSRWQRSGRKVKMLKIISSYSRDVWNVMDISVVSCAILSFYFKWAHLSFSPLPCLHPLRPHFLLKYPPSLGDSSSPSHDLTSKINKLLWKSENFDLVTELPFELYNVATVNRSH